MLRRRFIVRPLATASPQQRNMLTSSDVCPAVMTSCAGIFSASSPLFAPAPTTKKRIKAHGIIERDYVESVKHWKWDPFCTQFTKRVHSSSLKLPKARKMEPAMQVFGKLDIDDRVLRNQPRDEKTGAYIPVYEHCNIEEVMKGMGYVVKPDGTATRGYDDILKNNRRMVGQMSSSRRDEQNKSVRNEKAVDVGAAMFLQLCGFNDEENFELTSGGQDFRIFGKTCHSKPDWYMVESVNKDLVLIFEDKSVSESVKTLPSSGHLGQVVGEMLMMLSLNREQKTYRSVFGIRYINSHVCGFRLAPSKQQLVTLVESRNVPNKKLKLLCTEDDPVTSRGWSLIDKGERSKALRLMADIREFILSQ